MNKPITSSLANIYLHLVAVLLTLVAGAKLYSATGEAGILAASDPLLLLSNRTILIGVGFLELALAGYLFFGWNARNKHMLIIWMSLNFVGYRLAIWWLAPGRPCSCLGNLDEKLPVSGSIVNGGLKLMLACMVLGSLFFLLQPPLTTAWARWSRKARGRLKFTSIVIGILLLLPPLQIGCVATVQPHTTGPMIVRWTKGKLTDAPQAPSEFVWRDIGAVPTNFLQAVLAGEDARFFQHHGFDWMQIHRVVSQTLAEGKPPRGGASTITQQCARSLFLWQGRSWIRKGLEAYYTVWMELLLSKQRILELYVNVIEFGEGVYGLEAAAQHHFKIHAAELTREQSALLVAIMPNPKNWNPNQPSDGVLQRQALILLRSENLALPAQRSVL